ncbi:MAG: hypothetical protein AAFR11_12095 [Pseudomonadota bacterium]
MKLIALSIAALATPALADAAEIGAPDRALLPETQAAAKIQMTAEERLALAYPAPSRALMARIAGVDFSADLWEGAQPTNARDPLPTVGERARLADTGRASFGFKVTF